MNTERRTEQNNPGKGALVAAALLLVAAFVLFAAFRLGDDAPTEISDAQLHDTGFGLLYAFGRASFHAGCGGFFFTAGNAVRFHTYSGEELMNHQLALQNPAFYGRGEFAVALEERGFAARVFSRYGEVYAVHTQHPILSFSLGQGGHMTLIKQNGDRHMLYAYSPRGEVIAAMDLTHDRRIPVASDISRDGTRISVAFIDISGAQLNFVVFIYEVAEGGMRVMASHADNHGQVPGWLRFLDSGHLISISNREIRSYATDGGVLASRPINNTIAQVSFAKDYFVIALCAGILNAAYEPDGIVLIFDYALNATEFQLEDASRTGVSAPIASRIAANENGIIITSGRELTALSPSGQPLWRRVVTHDILHTALLGQDKLLLAGNNEARIFHVKTAAIGRP